jgi:hypothetical protein
VLGIEELRGEPLDVALAQEEPDVGPSAEDEQWTQVDAGYHPAPFDPQDPPAPEQQALHVEES